MSSNRKLPDWLTAYLDYTKYSESPDKFHFWTGVGTIAGALRRRVWLDMGYFEWIPNFYIILVAPPGIAGKSSTMAIGMQLLHKVDGITFGPDVITWAALAESLAESTRSFSIDGKAFSPMSAITIASSEFGNFLDPSDREMVDALVSLWDGQRGVFRKTTKTQGSNEIVNAAVNIIACTTPAWIAGNLPTYLIGGGFTSRCIFIYEDSKRRLEAYPNKKNREKELAPIRQNLTADLKVIASLAGEFKLTEEALTWGEAWYERHYNTPRPSNLDEATWGGYWARKQSHVHKLAIILAVSQRNELWLLPEDLIRATELLSMVEEDMPKVFRLIGRSYESTQNSFVIDAIKRHGGKMDRDLLISTLHEKMGVKEITNAVTSLSAAGLVVLVQKGSRVEICVTPDV